MSLSSLEGGLLLAGGKSCFLDYSIRRRMYSTIDVPRVVFRNSWVSVHETMPRQKDSEKRDQRSAGNNLSASLISQKRLIHLSNQN